MMPREYDSIYSPVSSSNSKRLLERNDTHADEPYLCLHGLVGRHLQEALATSSIIRCDNAPGTCATPTSPWPMAKMPWVLSSYRC